MIVKTKKDKKLLTFISPLLSVLVALYLSMTILIDSQNISFSLLSFLIFFLSILIFSSTTEIIIRVIYLRYLFFIETNLFVLVVFTYTSFLAAIIVSIMIFYQEGVPSHFLNSWHLVALFTAYFIFLFISLIISIIYIIVKNNKIFFLISLLPSFMILLSMDNNYSIFNLLIIFIIFLGTTFIIISRKLYRRQIDNGI
ncbi:hypothetical protein BHE86_16170 [Shigella sp. FC1655]|nr:hypothetical protein BGK50_17405 [Shigella sp. FC130]OEI94103.1 hypothetical protein BHE86_16170 [Shigella sp. FC1655]